MGISFSTEELQRVEEIKSHYPESKAAVMPLLWMSQKKWGWISDDVKKYVAGLLDLSYSHVHGVASFYTMYFKKPMGRYHIQICTNVSCMLGAGDEIFRIVSEKLGIGHMETTADGKYSLEEVECMGACGGAPMIAINEDYYENVDIKKVEELIDNLK
jgi:NADH-quinone oxidoreductase subunit E